MLYQLNYIHHIWDCKCKDYFRDSKNNLHTSLKNVIEYRSDAL